MIKFEAQHITRPSTVMLGLRTFCVLLAVENYDIPISGTKGRKVCLSSG